MVRLACDFALRAHRAELLEPVADEIRALPLGIERDAAIATMRVGEGDIFGAATILIARGAKGVASDSRVAAPGSLRAATLAHIALAALAAGRWTLARECIEAARGVLRADEPCDADEVARFDLLGIAAVVEVHTTFGDTDLGALESALAPLRERNLLTSAHALAQLCLGDVHHVRGDLGRAATHLATGLRLVPTERPGFVSHGSITLAFVRIRQGRWADAKAAVDTLEAPATNIEREWIRPQVTAVRALLETLAGRFDEGAVLLARAREGAHRTPSYLAAMVLLHTEIVGAVGRRDWRALRHALDDAEEPGYRHPYRPGEQNALRLLAAWQLGEIPVVRRGVETWAEGRDGPRNPYFNAFSALLAEHDGRIADGLVAAERALTQLGSDTDPLGRAWIRMVVASYLVRYGDGGAPDPARGAEVFAEARGELEALGAHHFARRCAQIEAQVRASLPSVGLTQQQRRIARAVALGYTSDQIAAMEYLSARTIDYHVANIMRRLGVGSRREIGRALGA